MGRNKIQIRDCPFCGTKEAENYLNVIDIGGPTMPCYYAVHCENCGSTGCGVTLGRLNKPIQGLKNDAMEEAVALWNERN